MIAKTDPPKTVRIKIKRCDEPGTQPYWDQFDIEYRPSGNLISALQQIAANPVNVSGKNVAPVVWDSCCLEEVCGACTMVVNGIARQSCSTLIHEMVKDGFGTEDNPVIVEPMSKFPIVRDLWVDRQRMFDNLKKVSGWVPIDGTSDLGPGPHESPESQDLRYALSRCMTCGCCLEACPQFTKDNTFMGAQVMAQTLYFNLHGIGKRSQAERLDAMQDVGGVADCGNAQNCVKVCPKELPLTEAIAAIGRQTTLHAIKKFFTGK